MSGTSGKTIKITKPTGEVVTINGVQIVNSNFAEGNQKTIRILNGQNESFIGNYLMIQFRFDKDKNYIYTSDTQQFSGKPVYQGTASQFRIDEDRTNNVDRNISYSQKYDGTQPQVIYDGIDSNSPIMIIDATTVTLSEPPRPTEGHPQQKGANQDAQTWKVVAMTNPPNMFKVVDSAGINVADQFTSEVTAQQYIDYYKWVALHGPVTPPAGGGPVAGGMIYKAKPGGFSTTEFKPQQGDCVSDGKRFNLRHGKKTAINRQTRWIVTLKKKVEKECLGNDPKPWWSPKLGSHGKSDEKTALVEASVFWENNLPKDGHGFKGAQMEGPHGNYQPFPKGVVKTFGRVPVMPVGKKVGIIGVQFLTKDGKNYITQFWYDFEHEGKGPYIKFCEVTDTPKGKGPIAPLEGSPGHYTLVGAENNMVDTMRGNGWTADCDSVLLEEIEVPDAPK